VGKKGDSFKGKIKDQGEAARFLRGQPGNGKTRKKMSVDLGKEKGRIK